MQRARSVRSADFKKPAILLLFALFFALLASAQTSPAVTQTKKKPASSVATKRTAVTRKTIAMARRSHPPEASTGTARLRTRKVVVTRKLIHGHWVRTTQVVRAEPGPVYQAHPEPERYQQIQQALADKGYFKGEANGQWGDDSVAALKQFQTEHKLMNDGKLSSLSLIALGLGPNREVGLKPVAVARDSTDSTPAATPPAAVDPVHN